MQEIDRQARNIIFILFLIFMIGCSWLYSSDYLFPLEVKSDENCTGMISVNNLLIGKDGYENFVEDLGVNFDQIISVADMVDSKLDMSYINQRIIILFIRDKPEFYKYDLGRNAMAVALLVSYDGCSVEPAFSLHSFKRDAIFYRAIIVNIFEDHDSIDILSILAHEFSHHMGAVHGELAARITPIYLSKVRGYKDAYFWSKAFEYSRYSCELMTEYVGEEYYDLCLEIKEVLEAAN